MCADQLPVVCSSRSHQIQLTERFAAAITKCEDTTRPMTRSRDAILQEIACEDSRLAELERARDEARARIELLRSELASAPTAAKPHQLPPAGDRIAVHTPADKVKLFRSLFQGRADIFPIRFESKKTGKPGYAPACSNKWEPGLCLLKTGGKCSDCLDQAFVPVGEQVVIDHLQGRHVMGAYPLLEDETCWFLADQWAFLTSVQRIEPASAETIAKEATRTGQVVGVRFAEAIDDEEVAAHGHGRHRVVPR